MEAMQAACARNFSNCIPTMHAQTHAVAFYERLGWSAQGDVFDEAGIPHVVMLRPHQPGSGAGALPAA